MLDATFDLPTHAEQPAVVDLSRDTPARVAAASLPAEVRFSVAAAEPPVDLAVAPWDATGAGGQRRGTMAGRPARHTTDPLERLQYARLTLLRRAGRGETLSDEDAARYAQATARLERLFPRVTPAEFERLASAADEIASLDHELEELSHEFRNGQSSRLPRVGP